MAHDAGSRESVLTSKLNRLFGMILRPDGAQYTPAQVASAINEAAGTKVISGTYVWQLRSGRRGNPTYEHLVALARFFGVPPSYFFEDDEIKRGEVPADVAAALQDDRVRDIALRTAGLSERSLKVISDMVDNVRSLDPPPAARLKPRQPRG